MALPHFVQSLPQELFDMIHDLVFTAPSSDRVLLSRDYKLPLESRISSTMRKQYLDSYFRNSTFVFTEPDSAKWVECLRRSDFDKIARFEIKDKYTVSQDRDKPVSQAQACWKYQEIFCEIMSKKGLFSSIGGRSPLTGHVMDLFLFSFRPAVFVDYKFEGRWSVELSNDGAVIKRVSGP